LVVVYVLVSASMEMAPSTISNLRIFVRRRDLLPDVNGDVERLKFSRYGLSDLASPDLLVSFRCYFVINNDSLCISTMYYLFQ
jgi:hypothetical protein